MNRRSVGHKWAEDERDKTTPHQVTLITVSVTFLSRDSSIKVKKAKLMWRMGLLHGA